MGKGVGEFGKLVGRGRSLFPMYHFSAGCPCQVRNA